MENAVVKHLWVRIPMVCALTFGQTAPAFSQVQPRQEQNSNVSNRHVLLNWVTLLLKDASFQRTGLSKEKIDELITKIDEIKKLSELQNPTDKQKKDLKSLLDIISPALQSIAEAYKRDVLSIAQGDIAGFTEKELSRIRSLCGGNFDDMLKAIKSPDVGAAFALQIGGKADECRLLLVDASNSIARQLDQLNATHASLQRRKAELEERLAAAASPQEQEQLRKALQENEAEVIDVENRQQKIQKIKGEVDWLAVLSGIALFVAGAVVAVYGDPSTGIGLMIAGGKLAESASNPPSKDVPVDVVTVTKTRAGLEPGKEPDPAATKSLLDEYGSRGFEPISRDDNKGNFIVFLDKVDKSWLVMQISPRKLVVRISPASVQVQPNGRGLKTIADLSNIRASDIVVSGPFNIRFRAKITGGADLSGGISEIEIGKGKYSLALDDVFKPK